MSGQRLYAMLCVRARAEVREKLGKKLRKGGTLNDDAAYTIITYPTVSGAVAAVAALFASEPLAQEARYCLGVVESRSDELGGRAANVIRSLADQAHPGQVLLTSAARDIARGNLPPRLTLSRLGDVMVESEISAELTWQLSGSQIHKDFPDLPGLYQYRSNVPEGDPIIGREEEFREVLRMASSGHLVSIVGPLGVGKTTFARYVASHLQGALTDGAIWVDARSMPLGRDPFEYLQTLLKLAPSSDYSAQDTLVNRLRSSQLLIVLDGCDDNANKWSMLLDHLLAECPDISFLVTCRSPLNVSGDQILGLDPFPVLQSGSSLDLLELNPGIRLFLTVANLSPNEKSIEIADDVVRKVAGLPLAIILAAGRMSELAPDNTGERQTIPSLVYDSLAAFVSWVLTEIPENELRTLRALSILEGNWTLALAERVCSLTFPELDAKAHLQRLINRRVVVSEPGFAGQRFTVMSVVREHLLDTPTDIDLLEWSYFRASSNLLQEIRSSSSAGFDMIKREYHHFECSAKWCITHRQTDSVDFLLKLGPYWVRRGPYKDAFEICKAATELKCASNLDKAMLLKLTGTLAGYAGDFMSSQNYLSCAARMFEALGDRREHASCLGNLAIHLRNSGDIARAATIFDEARKVVRDEDLTYSARISVSYLTALFESNQLEACLEALDSVSHAIYESGDLWARAALEFTVAAIKLKEGDGAAASELLKSSISHYRQVGDFQGLLCGIERAAFLSLRLGEYSRAARLLGGTEAGFLTLGISRARDLTNERDRAIEEISEVLGYERTEHYITEGSRLRLDEITDLSTLS